MGSMRWWPQIKATHVCAAILAITTLLSCTHSQPTPNADGTSDMEEKTVQRSFFQRLFGRPATSGPADTTCWVYAGGRVVIDLSRAAELQQPGGAFRLESDTLPTRLLIVHGEDGVYRAFRNRCTHMGRRLDPVPGTNRVQCCSIGKTTYGPDGEVIRGSGKEPLTVLPVRAENGSLIVDLSGIDP